MRRRRQTRQKFPWWLILILTANLIVHLIPQEWIIGPPPSEENNYNQSASTARELWQEAARQTDELMQSAEEILLDDSQWLALSDRKKIRLLERFAGAQAEKLGLRKHIDVEVKDLEDPIAGQYNNKKSTIYIDDVCFQQYRPEKLAHIICHEVRHAYQFALADAWINLCADSRYANLELFKVMEDCYEGLDNYCQVSEGMEAYQNQWVEEDARDYADEEMTRIFLKKDEIEKEK